MPKRQVRLQGPGVSGVRVNAHLLSELLTLLIEGSRGALRVRTEGRSIARGVLPRWISAATEFTIEIKEGSTLVEVDSPSLAEADPEEFRQNEMFPDIDPDKSAVDYLLESLTAATAGDPSSKLYDKPLLQRFRNLNLVFQHGVSRIAFESQEGKEEVVVEMSALTRFREIEARIPPPQRVNIAGKLDVIRHSSKTFDLLVGNEHVRGIAERSDLQGLWGQQVLIAGVAHFATNGAIQRVDAELIRPASETELHLFEVAPTPIGDGMLVREMVRAQGPRSGLNAIFGRWPGSESDEQITKELEQLS